MAWRLNRPCGDWENRAEFEAFARERNARMMEEFKIERVMNENNEVDFESASEDEVRIE